MADYFTNFSLVLDLPAESAQAYALKIASQAEACCYDAEIPADFPPCLVEVLEGWLFETETESSPGQWGLWLHSSSGGIDAVCAFIQHLLIKFQIKGSVGFEWSNDCSKPRTDAYGGGAVVVTASKIKSMTTGDWLSKQAARDRRQQENRK